jgi:FAD/FMN-containing dehydrogenase
MKIVVIGGGGLIGKKHRITLPALGRSPVYRRVVREQHGKDASYHPCVPPDAVAFAQSTEEVSQIVKLRAEHKVPIIPFGSGTGLEGHVVALRGGVCIDISRQTIFPTTAVTSMALSCSPMGGCRSILTIRSILN